ncbi:MAG: class I SAM-dependent methyltransferase [Roseburia sp.]
MKKSDVVIEFLIEDIVNKSVLEVACGAADFSKSAAKYADSVCCIDLDDTRVKKEELNNVSFSIMDASKMKYSDSLFDTVVLYNAFYHIQNQWIEIEKECKRVLKTNGKIIIISNWKLDVCVMKKVFDEQVEWNGEYCFVRITK